MDKRDITIIATIITILLCGIPGLVSICLAAAFIIAGPVFDNYSSDLLVRFTFFFFGLVAIAIPIALGVLAFRKRKPRSLKIGPDEPIPPPS